MVDTSEQCIFCDIVAGKAPADRVYEDDTLVAFHDIRPIKPIHILIVPRKHIPTLNDIGLTNQILSDIGRAAVKIAEQFGVAQSGYRVFISVNRGGGQEIFHLHMHLIAQKDSNTMP